MRTLKTLWKTYPKRIKFILLVAGALGFCLSLAIVLVNDVQPLSALAALVPAGTPVLGIVALLLANAVAMACMASAEPVRGSRPHRRDDGFAVNPSTGLMMVGGIDTGGNQLGGKWPD